VLRLFLATSVPLLAAGLLAACGPGGQEAGRARAAGAGHTFPVERPSPVRDSLRVSLDVPERVDRGEAVPMVLRVENAGESPVELRLTGRPPAFDLIVTDAAGDTVWRRLEEAAIQQILVLTTLSPGETLTFEDAWDQRSAGGEPVPPGTYTVRGELPAERGRLVSPAETLRVSPD